LTIREVSASLVVVEVVFPPEVIVPQVIDLEMAILEISIPLEVEVSNEI
jgi:hypothetical protein